MITLKLSQIGKENPADQNGRCFNVERKEFSDFADAFRWLADHYGIKKPSRIHDGNSVFEDRPDGGIELVGFLVRRWVENYDRSRDQPRHYWEENWISFRQFEAVPFDLKKAIHP
jgi:hypothetical protein